MTKRSQSQVRTPGGIVNKSYFPGGLKTYPSFAKGTASPSNRMPNPPAPKARCTRQHCAMTDGIYIPPGSVDTDSYKRASTSSNYFKIPDGWTCTIYCDDNAKTKLRLSCTAAGLIGGVLAKPRWWSKEELGEE